MPARGVTHRQSSMRTYHVYVISNRYRTVFYTGVTGDLPRRLAQHACGECGGFTARYRVTDLVYMETYGQVEDAIRREKQLKRWRREKKLALIRSVNPSLEALEY